MSERGTEKMYISFDMEWNQPYAKEQLKTKNDVTLYGEIVQIGAVKMNDKFDITDTFKVIIKPTVYKKMHKKISKMTGITDEKIKEFGVDREIAMAEFFAWCGDGCTFLTWGSDDYNMLEKNMKFFGFENHTEECYNLQCIFNYDTKCYGRQFSLDYAMETFNIEADRDRHDALNDAYYTALVCRNLKVKNGIENYETVSEISMQSEDFIKNFKYEGYETSSQAMKDKKVKHTNCPYCDGKSVIVKKCKQAKNKYVLLNRCKKHGYFISRIRFSKTKDKNLVTKNLYRYDETNKQYFEKKFSEWTAM